MQASQFVFEKLSEEYHATEYIMTYLVPQVLHVCEPKKNGTEDSIQH